MAAAAGGAVPLRDAVELVNGATNSILKEVDYGKVVTIADALTANPDPTYGQKVMEAIVKRLKDKNPEVGILALNLVDYLVKNCPRFHRHVGTKSFMKTMVGLTEDRSKKLFARLRDENMSAQMELRERALVLIQIWGQEFGRRNPQQYPVFAQTYNDLVGRGVRFPQPQKDEVAPVFTPAAHVQKAKGIAPPPADAPFTDAECLAAHENACVLHDLITASKDNESMMRNDLVGTLYQNCRGAQARFMERVLQGPSEDLLGEFLRVNDTLVEVIQYFEGVRDGKVERYRPPTPPPPAAAAATAAAAQARKPSQGAPPLLPQPKSPTNDSNEKKKKKKKKKPAGADDGQQQQQQQPLDLLFFDSPVNNNNAQPGAEEPSSSSSSEGDTDNNNNKSNVEEKKVAALNIPKLAPPPNVPRLSPPAGDVNANGADGGKKKKKKKKKTTTKSPAAAPTAAADTDDLFASLRLDDKDKQAPVQQQQQQQEEDDDDDPFLALATRTSSTKVESGIRQPENMLDAFDLLAKR